MQTWKENLEGLFSLQVQVVPPWGASKASIIHIYMALSDKVRNMNIPKAWFYCSLEGKSLMHALFGCNSIADSEIILKIICK